MSVIRRDEEDVTIDLIEIMRLLLSKWTMIVLCTLLLGFASYLGGYLLIVPNYQASITLYVNNRANADTNTVLSQSDLNAAAHLVDTYSAIITSKTVLKDVIAEAGEDITVEKMRASISTSGVNGTEVFQVIVKHHDAKAAARIANAIAAVAPEKIAEIVEGSSVKVVDTADIPNQISDPNYTRIAVMGMAIGFALSACIVIARAMMDTSIKQETDFERWCYPLLGSIPDLHSTERGRKGGYGYAASANRKRN